MIIMYICVPGEINTLYAQLETNHVAKTFIVNDVTGHIVTGELTYDIDPWKKSLTLQSGKYLREEWKVISQKEFLRAVHLL